MRGNYNDGGVFNPHQLRAQNKELFVDVRRCISWRVVPLDFGVAGYAIATCEKVKPDERYEVTMATYRRKEQAIQVLEDIRLSLQDGTIYRFQWPDVEESEEDYQKQLAETQEKNRIEREMYE